MSLQNLNNHDLLSGFKTLVQRERRVSREVLEYIAEIESRRIFLNEGYTSTHDWLVAVHNYSHGAAGRRVSAARMLCAVPEISEKIETGEFCMSSLSRIQSAIRIEEKRSGEVMSAEKKSEMLDEIELKPKAEIERSLAELFSSTAPAREMRQPKADGFTRMHVTFSEEQMQKIERAAELLSHKTESASIADALVAMAEIIIASNDPLEKIVKPRNKNNDAQVDRCGVLTGDAPATWLATPNKTAAIKPSTRNFVFRRDDGRCQFETADGVVCGSRKFTQIDHMLPRALGGSNDVENLRVLCRSHNLLMAEQVFGAAKMASYRKAPASNQSLRE